MVQAGSTASGEDAASLREAVIELRQELLGKGVLSPRPEGGFVFTADQLFNSPSTGRQLVAGNNRSGLDAWQNSAGYTLKQSRLWQEGALTTGPGAGPRSLDVSARLGRSDGGGGRLPLCAASLNARRFSREAPMSGLLRLAPARVGPVLCPRLRRRRPLNPTHTAIGLFALALFALAMPW